MKTKIIICTKNEEATLGKVIEELLKVIPMENIMLFDGHSVDKTINIAKEYNIDIALDDGKGKGSAIRKAIKTCTDSDILVFMDADGSHNPKDIPAFIKKIREDGYDLVIGSRILGGSDEANISFEHFIRSIGSQLVALTISLFFKKSISDVENGFRAIKRKSFSNIILRSDGFTIEQEMVIMALKNNLSLCEIPSHEFKRKGGESKLSTFEGWRFILNMVSTLLFRKK